VSSSREIRDRDIKEKSKGLTPHEYEGYSRDKRRDDIRRALDESSRKAVQPKPDLQTGEVPAGAPATWSREAKVHWDSLPPQVKTAALRDHAGFQKPMAEYAELDKVLSPHREVYRQHGVKNDAEAVQVLLRWEQGLRNPETRMQALQMLAQSYGVDLGQVSGAAQQPRNQVEPQEAKAIEGHLTKFSEGRPHFNQVRTSMGMLISAHPERYSANGKVDLDRAYREACRIEGLSNPRPPSPAAPGLRRQGPSVRDELVASIARSRGAAA